MTRWDKKYRAISIALKERVISQQDAVDKLEHMFNGGRQVAEMALLCIMDEKKRTEDV